MTIALVFWVLMLIWLVWSLPVHPFAAQLPYAGNILLFVLFLLLGWRVFGQPIHG